MIQLQRQMPIRKSRLTDKQIARAEAGGDRDAGDSGVPGGWGDRAYLLFVSCAPTYEPICIRSLSTSAGQASRLTTHW